jgi:ABC-type transporter Mla subunit MlaD
MPTPETSRTEPGRGRARIQKLATAALNADVTIDQAATVINDLSTIVADMDSTMSNFDETVARVNANLEEFERLLVAIAGTLEKADTALERFNTILSAPLAIVGAADSVIIAPAVGVAETIGRWFQARR